MYISELKQPSQTLHLQTLVKQFLPAEGTVAASRVAQLGEDIFDSPACTHTAYIVCSGQIEVELNGKLIYFYEAGDFIVKPDAFSSLINPIFRCNGTVELQGYDWNNIRKSLQDNRLALESWTEYQATFNAILVQALSFYSSHTKEPSSDYLSFEPGEIIIEQGQRSNQVFTLVEGQASAYQNKTKVGEIYEDEIFGAMAAFTNSERSASVVANESTTVRAVKQEDFVEMVRLQPEICRSLIEDMARKIQDLNDSITRLQKGHTDTVE